MSRRTAASALTGSICRRNWPCLTRSPSCTPSRVTRPIVWALMLTVFFGSILPDAETMASRSRFWIVSTVTSVPVSPRRANAAIAAPPAISSTITIQNHFLRSTTDPPRSNSTAKHCEYRGDDRGDTDIDSQQLPDVSPHRLPGRRRHAHRKQPYPPQAEHVDGAEQPLPPRPFVEQPKQPGHAGRTRQRLVGVMQRRCHHLLHRQHHRSVNDDCQGSDKRHAPPTSTLVEPGQCRQPQRHHQRHGRR